LEQHAADVREYLDASAAMVDRFGAEVRKKCEAAAREPWNAAEAHQREREADALVEQLGVSGTDPRVKAAAERVVVAHFAHDAARHLAAVANFIEIVKAVSADRRRGPPTR
jgi:hypothetical protein